MFIEDIQRFKALWLYIVIYDFSMNVVSDNKAVHLCLRQSPSCWSGQVVLRISDHRFIVTHRFISRAGRQQDSRQTARKSRSVTRSGTGRNRIRTNSYFRKHSDLFLVNWVRDMAWRSGTLLLFAQKKKN